jgi:hypothetical protein
MNGWYVNYELERMWKEAFLAFSEVTEEKHENLIYDSRDLNLGPPKNEAGMLTTGPQRSVICMLLAFTVNVTERD